MSLPKIRDKQPKTPQAQQIPHREETKPGFLIGPGGRQLHTATVQAITLYRQIRRSEQTLDMSRAALNSMIGRMPQGDLAVYAEETSKFDRIQDELHGKMNLYPPQQTQQQIRLRHPQEISDDPDAPVEHSADFVKDCPNCEGEGVARKHASWDDGLADCNLCHGTGRVVGY